MRRLLIPGRCYSLAITLAVAVGLLLQSVLPAPAQTGSPDTLLLSLGSICHADGSTQPDPTAPTESGHDHCLFCGAFAPVALLPDPTPRLDAPRFVRLAQDIPAALQQRVLFWRAYTSRAPPGIG